MRSLLLAPLVVGLAYAAQEAGPKKSATFSKGTLEALGACEVRPESVACWDLSGAKSPELEDSIRGLLSNGNEIQFKFGKKNRVLAFRRPQSLNFQYRADANNSLYGNWTVSGDPTTEFVRIPADPSAKQVVITAMTSNPGDKDEEISFKEGSTAQIDGRKLEIGAMQKVTPTKTGPNSRGYNYYGQPRPTEGWTVVMGLSGAEGQFVVWNYVALDTSGQPIRYVDAQGKPITAMKALALEPNLQNGNYYPNNGEPQTPKPKAAMAYFQGGGAGPAFRATTNIDPKAIGTLRIRATHSESAELGPFPLDPK